MFHASDIISRTTLINVFQKVICLEESLTPYKIKPFLEKNISRNYRDVIMQAYRDYIGGHKLEFLPRLKRCQNYPSPTSMSPTPMTHVTWVIEAISMTRMFVRSYNLTCKAFLYLTSINSSSCLSKAKIIIGDLNPACWWVPVEQSITFISKNRFFVTSSLQNCHKSGSRDKNGSFEATGVSLPSNVDLILDLPNLWHPNQQACIPADLNWRLISRHFNVTFVTGKKSKRVAFIFNRTVETFQVQLHG